MLAGFVNGRSNNMRWRLLGELNDVFAQVRFDHLVPEGFKVRIEMDLLRRHRFAFDDGLCPCLLRNLGDDPSCFGRIVGPMDVCPEALKLGGELLQIFVKVGNSVLFHRPGLGAEFFRVAQGRHRCHPAGSEIGGEQVQRLLERGILQGLFRVGGKLLSSQMHDRAPFDGPES